MKNKPPAIFPTTTGSLSRDTHNKSNNTNEKTNIKPLSETMLKPVHYKEMG